MIPLRFQNPIAISATLDAQRRLVLPKSLGLEAPVVLIALEDGGEIRLGFSNTASVEVMSSRGMTPSVLLECKSLRSTIPKKVCVAHSLTSSSKVWLVAMDCWISIWSEMHWDAEFDKAMYALGVETLTFPATD